MVPDMVRKKLDSSKLLPKDMSSLCSDFDKLVIHLATKQTWAKHCSAWALFDEFCTFFGIKFELPISPELARAFVTWALSKKKLKSSTVRSYISSVNKTHILGNIKNVNLSSDPCIKLLLKGASKSCDLELNNKTNRLPMNLPLLKILSHRIALLDWSDLSKQAFWTACTVSFFTSCRMAELLTSSVKNFDPDTSLLWKHVKFLGEKEIVIILPYNKTTGFKGKAVDVFPLINDK